MKKILCFPTKKLNKRLVVSFAFHSSINTLAYNNERRKSISVSGEWHGTRIRKIFGDKKEVRLISVNQSQNGLTCKWSPIDLSRPLWAGINIEIIVSVTWFDHYFGRWTSHCKVHVGRRLNNRWQKIIDVRRFNQITIANKCARSMHIFWLVLISHNRKYK